jgi:SAM-dependent methyltransferase
MHDASQQWKKTGNGFLSMFSKEKINLDTINKINRDRWNALARANVEYTRPYLDFTHQEAETYIYRYGILKDVAQKRVLCLAGGGGQDSVAFGLLGAEVTVLDLSDEQLARDRLAADQHGLEINTLQGDMRDLSAFADDQFDIVWQPYSINFVPGVDPVFQGVARLLREGGIYFLQFANPFIQAVDDEAWNGSAYPLSRPYIDGEDLTTYFPHWDVEQADGTTRQLASPHEFRHIMSTVLNSLIKHGFAMLHFQEWMKQDTDPQLGTWPHFTQVAPPWFDSFWRLNQSV